MALLKAGALLKTDADVYSFATPLAERYFARLAFPSRTRDAPTSLPVLIEKAIGRMSAVTLASGVPPTGTFPKESAFQHELHKALAESLPPTFSVVSDLSRTSGPYDEEDGELDFYVNNNLKYGIEVLVQGDKIGEHIDRFTPGGMYENIPTNDRVVLDFRQSAKGKPTAIKLVKKERITVFFKRGGDFTKCSCLFGMDPKPKEINLSP